MRRLRHPAYFGRGHHGGGDRPGSRRQGQGLHPGLPGQEHGPAARGGGLMRERGDMAVGLLVAFLLLFPLGYVLHVAPRFPGSLVGGVIGVVAAVLMLLTLPYVVVKHVKAAERWTGRFVSKPTLLALHVYAGVLAPILGLVHAAHKFGSPVGLTLTGLVLLTVLSGFVGRYLLAQTARALRGRRSELASLQAAYLHLPAPPAPTAAAGALSRWKRPVFVP